MAWSRTTFLCNEDLYVNPIAVVVNSNSCNALNNMVLTILPGPDTGCDKHNSAVVPKSVA